jgi:phage gpG-like protein
MAMSLSGAAAHFGALAIMLEHKKHDMLDRAAQILQTEAKRVLGTYDYGWPALKPSTIAGKSTGDSPLLEKGDLRDSIERDVQTDKAYVGSNDKKALFHEFGTSRIPPRPFFGGAVNAKHSEIGEMIGKTFHGALVKT